MLRIVRDASRAGNVRAAVVAARTFADHPRMSVTVSSQDVSAAARRLAGHAVLTPLLQSPALNERCGATVLLKPENLQIAGAFKFRGAYNRLVQLNEAERA